MKGIETRGKMQMGCCHGGMHQHDNKLTLGYKLAALLAGIDIACGVIVYTFPNAAHKILQYLTHSSWQFEIVPFDPAQFAISAVLWALIGIALGWIIENWLFATAINERGLNS